MQAKSPQVGEASFEAGSSGPPSRGRSCSSEAALDLLVGVGAVSAFKRSPIVLDGAAASSQGGGANSPRRCGSSPSQEFSLQAKVSLARRVALAASAVQVTACQGHLCGDWKNSPTEVRVRELPLHRAVRHLRREASLHRSQAQETQKKGWVRIMRLMRRAIVFEKSFDPNPQNSHFFIFPRSLVCPKILYGPCMVPG